MSFDLPVLPENWAYATLDSCSEKNSVTYGVVQPGASLVSGKPLIRVNNFRDTRIDLSDVMYIAPEIEAKYSRTRLKGGEVLLTIVGTVGQVAVVPSRFAGFNVARAVAVIHPLAHIAPEWIALCLRSPLSQHLLGSRANTTVQTTINLKDLRALPIPLPPADERLAIAEFIETLDDRITLLRETNATLEAIAQALFKSWFVDFDPVRAKMEGRIPEGMDEATAALFPDGFEESELGLVPRGWRVAQCQDLFEVRDGTHESPKPSLDGYPLVTSKHITSGQVNFQDTYLISEVDYAAISKRSKVNRLDVLITMIGTVGLSAILLDDRNDFAIKNIGLFKTSAAPNFAYFLSLLLKSIRMQEYLSARLAGTTQKYLSLKALREIGLLVPAETVLVEFSKIASSLFDVIQGNSQQVQTLVTLRDTLLPRLISGALRLHEADLKIQEAAI